MATTTALPVSTVRAPVLRGGTTQSPFRRTMHRLLRHRSAQIGIALMAMLLFIAIFADVLAPYAFDEQLRTPGTKPRLEPCVHLLGCEADKPQFVMGLDSNRRDVLSRILFGSRLSLSIGFITTGVAVLFGTVLGAIAGYVSGWSDTAIMRTMDIFQAFPSLLLAIAIVSVLGSGLVNTLIAVAIVDIPTYARIARASVLGVKELEYVNASKALGASPMRILFTRLLPNSLTPLIVAGTLGIGTTILSAAGLSFLGLGAQPPLSEWGLMLGAERASVFSAPHLMVFAGVAIMFTVLAFNLLGDGLRDALDPRRKA